MDNLTRDVIAARAAGMSYGKWKALHPETSEKYEQDKKFEVYLDERVKICPICNREFIPSPYSNKYCSKPCSDEGNRLCARIRHRNKMDAKRAAMKSGESDDR